MNQRPKEDLKKVNQRASGRIFVSKRNLLEIENNGNSKQCFLLNSHQG